MDYFRISGLRHALARFLVCMTMVSLWSLGAMPVAAIAPPVTLVWDENAEPDLVGYRVYYGPVGVTPYPDMVDVGMENRVEISDLEENTDYIFVATAFNALQLESAPSAPVFFRTPSVKRPPRAGRYHLEWSGQSQGNTATAKGFVVMGVSDSSGASTIKDFQITVSNARGRSHNGTFKSKDFSGLLFDLSGDVDFTRNLVGQGGFDKFSFSAVNPNAPNAGLPNVIQTGGGGGESLALMSITPLVSTNVRVYKGSLSAKGLYKYCDEDFFGPGVPQWVSSLYSAKASYYMILDAGSELMSFIYVDPKLKQIQRIVDCALPELKYFQSLAPSFVSPAGSWKVDIPLWSHKEEIDIDPASGTPDASRSRILNLSGSEGPLSFPLPLGRTIVRDQGVGSLGGSFFQVTTYDDFHYAFNDPKRDKVLSWTGPIRRGGGLACLDGTLSCRLDTITTGVAIENGDGIVAGEEAVIAPLLAKGWKELPAIDCAGGPLTLQPTGGEILEPLIP